MTDYTCQPTSFVYFFVLAATAYPLLAIFFSLCKLHCLKEDKATPSIMVLVPSLLSPPLLPRNVSLHSEAGFQ